MWEKAFSCSTILVSRIFITYATISPYTLQLQVQGLNQSLKLTTKIIQKPFEITYSRRYFNYVHNWGIFHYNKSSLQPTNQTQLLDHSFFDHRSPHPLFTRIYFLWKKKYFLYFTCHFHALSMLSNAKYTKITRIVKKINIYSIIFIVAVLCIWYLNVLPKIVIDLCNFYQIYKKYLEKCRV